MTIQSALLLLGIALLFPNLIHSVGKIITRRPYDGITIEESKE